MRRLALALGLVAALAAPAAADRDRALEIYDQGKAKYSAGEYEAAIEKFERAYEEDPAPAYLYNIAQAYRQLEDCGRALSFYKKFQKAAPEASAGRVERYVEELEAECGGAEAEDEGPEPKPSDQGENGEPPAGAPALETSGPEGVADPAPAADRGGAEDGALGVQKGTRRPRSRVIATAEAGAAFFDIGDVVLPVSATLRLGAAYPMELGPVTVEAGALAELSTMPYEEASGDSTALLSTLLVNVGATYPVLERLRVGGEIGAGALLFSGLEAGNPFSEGAMETGMMTSFAVRVGAFAEYRLLRRLSVSLTPAYAYAGAGGDLRGAISSVSRFEILTGVRYRF